MKNIIKAILITGAIVLGLMGWVANAAPTSTYVQNLFITGLAGGGTECLHILNSGLVQVTAGSDCGSGGGGGSSTVVFGVSPIVVSSLSNGKQTTTCPTCIATTTGNWAGTWQLFNASDFLSSSTSLAPSTTIPKVYVGSLQSSTDISVSAATGNNITFSFLNPKGYVTSTITIGTTTASGVWNVTSSGNKAFTITLPSNVGFFTNDKNYATTTIAAVLNALSASGCLSYASSTGAFTFTCSIPATSTINGATGNAFTFATSGPLFANITGSGSTVTFTSISTSTLAGSGYLNLGQYATSTGSSTIQNTQAIPNSISNTPASRSQITKSTTNGATGTSLTLTAPSNIVNGNTLVIVAKVDGNNTETFTFPAGFTQVAPTSGSLCSIANSKVCMAVAVKTAASESGSYTVTWNHAASLFYDGVMLNIPNVSSTVDGTPGTGANNGSTVTIANTTPTYANDLLLTFSSQSENGGGLAVQPSAESVLAGSIDTLSAYAGIVQFFGTGSSTLTFLNNGNAASDDTVGINLFLPTTATNTNPFVQAGSAATVASLNVTGAADVSSTLDATTIGVANGAQGYQIKTVQGRYVPVLCANGSNVIQIDCNEQATYVTIGNGIFGGPTLLLASGRIYVISNDATQDLPFLTVDASNTEYIGANNTLAAGGSNQTNNLVLQTQTGKKIDLNINTSTALEVTSSSVVQIDSNLLEDASGNKYVTSTTSGVNSINGDSSSAQKITSDGTLSTSTSAGVTTLSVKPNGSTIATSTSGISVNCGAYMNCASTVTVSSTLASSTWGSFSIFQNQGFSTPMKTASNVKRTLTYFGCDDDKGTSTITIDKATTNVTTTYAFIATLVCGAGGNSTTTFGTSTINAGEYLIATSTIAGSPSSTNAYLYSQKQ